MSHNDSDQVRLIKPILVNFFVYSKFGLHVLFLTLLFLAVSFFFIGAAFYQQYQQIIEIFNVVDSQMQHELVINDIVIRNMVFLGVAIVTYIGVMIFLIIRAHHRYDGPLVSIQKFVQDVGEGDYKQRLVIRKGDEMQNLAVLLNCMAESLHSRHGLNSSPRHPKSPN